MSFLSPAFLFGLPLLAIPVILHLLSRRQRNRIGWGAMRFLVQAATRKRRLWRLTDLLLLLLRTAAVACLVFALARPLLPAGWLGGVVPREFILVLDPSLSTTRPSGGSSIFRREIQRAGEWLDRIHSADSVRVLLAGESPEWLTPEAEPGEAARRSALRAELDRLQPGLGAGDLFAAVREATGLEPAKDKSARVIVVISDTQRFGWHLDEPASWSVLETRLTQARIPTEVRLDLLGMPESNGNLSVSRIEAARAFGARGHPLTVQATVVNHGPNPSASTLLSWRVDGEAAGVATIPELAAGASTTVSLGYSFATAGTHEILAHLDVGDDLPPDNEARLLVEIYEKLPVLLVEAAEPTGAGSTEDPLARATPFLLAALGAGPGAVAGDWRSVFEPTVVAPAALPQTDLGRFHCVVLADPGNLGTAELDHLERYVRQGGGLWLALGPRTDPQNFAERWYRGGLGLAPMSVGTPVGNANDREHFTSLRAGSDAHPATALLADFQRLDLDRVRIYRRHSFDGASGKDVSVLLQGSDGEPLVVERKIGQGRVIVQAFPLGVAWSTFPLCQAYVACLHEWFWYLSEPALPRRNLAVGEPLVETAPDAKSRAQLELPNRRRLDLEARAGRRGPEFFFPSTRWAGAYALQTEGRTPSAGRTPPAERDAQFQVWRTPGESDLAAWTDADRQAVSAFPGFHFEGDRSPVPESGRAGETPVPKHPLEGVLLTVLAAVLLGELAVAGWATHRRGRPVKIVSMEA